MFRAHENIVSMSETLSKALSDRGVDESIVLKRRRAALLEENMETISSQLQNLNFTAYHFGSQSEGTTIMDLNSDSDILICVNDFNVIQDISDWKPDVKTLMMIQDDTVSPGYCLLQPLGELPNCTNHLRERKGKILLKNKYLADAGLRNALYEGQIIHGPAITLQNQPGLNDHDFVYVFPCKSWPLQARQWLDWQGVGQWPSADMRRYCGSTGCFLVGTGSKGSEHEELEWRISTSLAERRLMFSLNITQIRCYVLMKMILKRFIKPYFKDTISSFMCKTVMFHCIANTHSNIWRENNLYGCLSLCLFVLHHCILNENCPHFIIPGNNLMKGKIPHTDKPYILQKIRDNLAHWWIIPPRNVGDVLSGQILKPLTCSIEHVNRSFLNLFIYKNSSNEEVVQTLQKYITKLAVLNQREGVDKTACRLLEQRFCTSLGTVLASQSIQLDNTVSEEALTWISLGLNTDVSSSKLKLASIYYCIGDTHKTEITLRNIERSYDLNTVEPICGCHFYNTEALRKGFFEKANDHSYEEAMQHITALCVKFLPYEIKCAPHELQYEMYRSTKADLAFRPPDENWIKWAVVDSLPYLYFLQYKTYKSLGKQDEKKRALSNLLKTTDREPNLGHKETALNLLGQCMEQEDRATDALHCYSKSLNLRKNYNAAKIHICRLLSSLLTNK
ncbi:uncharacterized protein LOC128545892 [Mercenaria mercenaria]|uniref:uncharacterized protein LOC128545892 n=1 Tax=Mercenaria mercenaria TaxID=6596 RepID=UPI00234FA01F|nr:uncharacterized protein LOC128545892 [Mercenaria mercenaria]